MAQFTPPQSNMQPIIQAMLLDKLKQQQFERSQNALVQREIRAQGIKTQSEKEKREWALAVKGLETGLVDPRDLVNTDGTINLLAAANAIQKSAQITQQGDVDKNLQPLVEPTADVGRIQEIVRQQGNVATPGQQAQIRNMSQLISRNMPQDATVHALVRERASAEATDPEYRDQLTAAIEQAGAPTTAANQRIGQLALGELSERRQDRVERAQQATKESQAGVLKQRAFDSEVFKARRTLQQVEAQHGAGSQEFRDALFLYRSAQQSAQKNRAGVSRTTTFNTETGEMTVEEGIGGSAGAHRDVRAIKTVQGLENTAHDLDRIIRIMVNNPESVGTVGGMKRIFQRFSGIAADIVTADLLPGADIMEPDVARAIKRSQLADPTVQTLEVAGERIAYLWVRAQRGNGRITNEQLNDAKKLFRLVGGWASSAENINRLREFQRLANRDARQARGNLENQLGITFTNTSFEPLPELPPAEEGGAEGPKTLRDSVEDAANDVLREMMGRQAPGGP